MRATVGLRRLGPRERAPTPPLRCCLRRHWRLTAQATRQPRYFRHRTRNGVCSLAAYEGENDATEREDGDDAERESQWCAQLGFAARHRSACSRKPPGFARVMSPTIRRGVVTAGQNEQRLTRKLSHGL
jgi:hypothetical protein